MVETCGETVAHHVGIANRPGFSSPRPDNARIRRSNGQRADGLHWLVIKNRHESFAAVSGFPDAARSRAMTELTRQAFYRRLVERVPAILWSTDPDLRVVASLGAGAASLGYSLGSHTLEYVAVLLAVSGLSLLLARLLVGGDGGR